MARQVVPKHEVLDEIMDAVITDCFCPQLYKIGNVHIIRVNPVSRALILYLDHSLDAIMLELKVKAANGKLEAEELYEIISHAITIEQDKARY